MSLDFPLPDTIVPVSRVSYKESHCGGVHFSERSVFRGYPVVTRCLAWLSLSLGLVLTAADATVPIDGRTYTVLDKSRYEHFQLSLELTKGAGLDLVFAADDPANYARLLWTADELRLERTDQGETTILLRQSTGFPAALGDGGTVLLRRQPQRIEVIAGGQRVCRVMAPPFGKGLIAVCAAKGYAGVAKTEYQRIESVTFGDDFMRTEEEGKNLGLWQVATGNWRMYSVMETIHANPDARIREGYEPLADRSPNPFCLSGDGPDGAYILVGQPFWSDYRVGVSVRSMGSEFGLVFGAEDADTCWLVRWRLYSLGVKPNLLELVRREKGKEEVAGAVQVAGRALGWYRLEVENVGSRIEVLVDGSPVLTHHDDRAVGGRIGLYAKGTAETLFDDVALASVSLLDLSDPVESAPTRQELVGNWEIVGEPTGCVYASEGSREPAMLQFGYDDWSAAGFAATVAAAKGSVPALLLGIQDRANLLRAEWDVREKEVRLVRVEDGKETTLGTCALAKPDTSHALLVNTDETNHLQVFVDGQLAIRQPLPAVPVGPVGLAVGGKGEARFSAVRAFAVLPRDWEHEVDIKRFADDPFMQGWASPRYAWILDPACTVEQFPQRYIHKGDFYGPFRISLPVDDGLVLTFGGDEPDDPQHYELALKVSSATAGNLVLTRAGKEMANVPFTPGERQVLPGQQIVDEKIGALPKTPDTVSYGRLTLHRDGHEVWAELDGKEVLAVHEDLPLMGRAVLLTVPRPVDLLHVSTARAQLLDYLFETAATDWLQVGTWEVTNRFACDPRWSHMNGRGKGVAALWNKLEFVGDFTVEYYAGMRMRQGEMHEGAAQMYYPRVGDINVAFEAEDTDLFSGHNVILQAWDPQWTEKASEFLRLGKVLAENDHELIPRGRHSRPKARVVEVAWDPGGRPVHGAWYFVSIRKTGNHYDVSFDNFPVFSVTDDDPLTGKRLALWTQHNSIVIARAKIGYRQVERPTPKVAAVSAAPPQAKLDPLPYRLQGLTQPGMFLDFEEGIGELVPYAGDQSAELSLVPRPGGDGQALRLENLYGGGDFGVVIPLAGSAANRLDRLEFDYAIPPAAKLNLYLTLAERPAERWFVTLTGPDEEGPNLYRLGRFPGAKADGAWHHASFALGSALRQALPYEPRMTVKNLTIGMLHEGYLNAGLGGNPGGAVWYLDNLLVASHGPAEAMFAWTPLDQPAPAKYRVWFAPGDAPTPLPTDAAVRTEGDFSLTLPQSGDWLVQAAVEQDGEWRNVSPVPVRVCEPAVVARTEPADQETWDGGPIRIYFAPGERANVDLSRCQLRLGEGAPIPASEALTRFDAAQGMLEFQANLPGLNVELDKPVSFTFVYGDDLLPCPPEPAKETKEDKPAAAPAEAGAAPAPEPVKPELRPLPSLPVPQEASYAWTMTLPAAGDHVPPSPVSLLADYYRRLDFESGPALTSLVPGESLVERVPHGDGHALRITNRLCGSTFGTSLGWSGFDLGQNPLLSFDYRIDPESNVAFQLQLFGRPYQVSLTDTDDERGKLLGQIPGIVADGTWHHAEVDLISLVVANVEARRQARSLHVGKMDVGDFGYSGDAPGAWYELDNLNLIPLVSASNGLELKWQASDAGGIGGYSYLWDDQPATEPDATPETAANVASFKDLPEGKQYFHIRAIDHAGNPGPSTHYAYVIDNTPPTIVGSIPANGEKAAASQIVLKFGDSVSQVNAGSLQLFVDKRRLSLQGDQVDWNPETRELTVDLLSDWSLLRRPLTDGQDIPVSVSGIKDFAGNEAPAYEFSWKVDFAQDHEPPPAPYLWSYSGQFQVFDHFGNTRHNWRAYAMGGPETTLAERVWDQELGTWYYHVAKIASGPRFGAYRYNNENIVDSPQVTFDIRIMPGTKVNFLLYIDKKYYAVQLTGGDKLPVIGQVPEVKDDGQWHHVEIDLLPMLRQALPDAEGYEARMCAIAGWSDGNEVGACFDLDNFGFIGARAPLPLFNYSSADATGISRYRIAFDQNPTTAGTGTETTTGGAGKQLLAADKAGMWYIHAAACDGAGNWSETVHYPYLCTSPVAEGKVDGLEADDSWQPTRGRKSVQAYVYNAMTSGGNHLLAIQVVGQRDGELELSRQLTGTPLAGTVKLTASVYSSADAPLKLQAVLKGYSGRKLTSDPVELKPNAWTPDIAFVFPEKLPTEAGKGGERWTLSFATEVDKRSRDMLLFDAIELSSTAPAPAEKPAPAKP